MDKAFPPEVEGLLLSEARAILERAGYNFVCKSTCPPGGGKTAFPLGEEVRVIRQRLLPDSGVELLAASDMKPVDPRL